MIDESGNEKIADVNNVEILNRYFANIGKILLVITSPGNAKATIETNSSIKAKNSFTPALKIVFNKVLVTHLFTETFKEATVIPVH